MIFSEPLAKNYAEAAACDGDHCAHVGAYQERIWLLDRRKRAYDAATNARR